MAEIATIARPYAEALLKAAKPADLEALAAQVNAMGAVAAHPQLRDLAGNPNVTDAQVFDVVGAVAGVSLSEPAKNLLRTVIDNGRIPALPEIAAQFHALVNARSGVSDALIESAFPIEAAQLPGVVAALEKRFGRKLNPSVVIAPELIGGIRVTVGDEVLDTSVASRLDNMKVALGAA
jgi:F-type H+-transporting ATPase subunit delta